MFEHADRPLTGEVSKNQLKPTRVGVGDSKPPIICDNCEKEGHKSRQCTSPKVTCGFCKKEGHLKKFCNTMKAEMKKKADEAATKQPRSGADEGKYAKAESNFAGTITQMATPTAIYDESVQDAELWELPSGYLQVSRSGKDEGHANIAQSTMADLNRFPKPVCPDIETRYTSTIHTDPVSIAAQQSDRKMAQSIPQSVSSLANMDKEKNYLGGSKSNARSENAPNSSPTNALNMPSLPEPARVRVLGKVKCDHTTYLEMDSNAAMEAPAKPKLLKKGAAQGEDDIHKPISKISRLLNFIPKILRSGMAHSQGNPPEQSPWKKGVDDHLKNFPARLNITRSSQRQGTQRQVSSFNSPIL